jgi:hypothetical protein
MKRTKRRRKNSERTNVIKHAIVLVGFVVFSFFVKKSVTSRKESRTTTTTTTTTNALENIV